MSHFFITTDDNANHLPTISTASNDALRSLWVSSRLTHIGVTRKCLVALIFLSSCPGPQRLFRSTPSRRTADPHHLTWRTHSGVHGALASVGGHGCGLCRIRAALWMTFMALHPSLAGTTATDCRSGSPWTALSSSAWCESA